MAGMNRNGGVYRAIPFRSATMTTARVRSAMEMRMAGHQLSLILLRI